MSPARRPITARPTDQFAEHLCDLLAGIGTVQARRMFGGHGVYCDGLMFGLIANGQFYLKADDGNRETFASLGLSPFKPFPDKPTLMPYYPVPDSVLDDLPLLLGWARSARDASLRAATAKAKRATRTKTRKQPADGQI